MEISVSFDGCSCGCTPYETVLFEGQEPDIYIAIASWALDYTVRGDPFRKLDIPEESKKYCEEVFKVQDQIKEPESQLRKLDVEIQDIENRSNKYQEASELLGVALPDNIVQILSELENQKKNLIAQSQNLKSEISELKSKINHILSYDYGRARRLYDDDDEDDEDDE